VDHAGTVLESRSVPRRLVKRTAQGRLCGLLPGCGRAVGDARGEHAGAPGLLGPVEGRVGREARLVGRYNA
jgi:hypothetical protein